MSGADVAPGSPVGHPPPDAAPPPPAGAPPPDTAPADLGWTSLAQFALTAVAAVVALTFARAVDDTLRNVVVAAVGALALDRLVGLLERRTRLGRQYAVGAVLLVAAALLAAVATLLVPAVVAEAEQLGDEAPEVLQELTELPVVGRTLAENDVPAQAQRWLESVPERLASDGDAVLSAAGQAVIQATSALSTLLLVFLLLLEGPALTAAARRLVRPRWRARADAVGRSVQVAIGRYAVGSLLLALLAGTAAFAIGVAFSVPLVPLAAVWAMLWNFVPQLGGIVGGAVLVLLALTDDVSTGVVVLVVWLVYMQVENRLVQPVVVGRAVQLSPLTTLVIGMVGVAVAGLAGAVLAIPLVAAATAARRELQVRR